MLVRLNLVLGRVAVDDLVIGELQLRPRARHAVEHRTEGRGQSLEIRVLVLRVHLGMRDEVAQRRGWPNFSRFSAGEVRFVHGGAGDPRCEPQTTTTRTTTAATKATPQQKTTQHHNKTKTHHIDKIPLHLLSIVNRDSG